MADGGGESQDLAIAQGDWAGWNSAFINDPFETLVGPFYVREDAEGRPVCAFRAEPRHMNNGGFMHGGCIMTLADVSLFVIARKALGPDRHGVTVSLTGDFVGPGAVGDLVEASGEVVRAGGSLLFIRGLIAVNSRSILSFSGVIKRTKPR